MHIHTDDIKRNRGVTLIELMIGMVITAVIMAAFVGLLGDHRKTYIGQQSRAECEEAVSRVHGELLDKIRMSGYMIPDSISGVVPYPVSGGSDSIKVIGNYDNFIAQSLFNINVGDDEIYTLFNDRYRPHPGMHLMIRTPEDTLEPRVYSGEVKTAITFLYSGTKYIYFEVEDTIKQKFPAGSRVSLFNEYVYKVMPGADGEKVFGVRVNDGPFNEIVSGIENIDLTYETRGDTTDRDSLTADSLDLLFAVNLAVRAKSKTSDYSYTHPDFGDHFRRASLESKAVILNVAITKN